MGVKELLELINQDVKVGMISHKCYWNQLWSQYISEHEEEFKGLEVKDALPKLISDVNFRERKNYASCQELGVDIRVGDICYIDFGEAYICEIGFQHFGLILTLFHNKAFVVPMSGNYVAFHQAYGKKNPKGKKHLMRLGKIKGMNKQSVLFLNDAKWINTARIIDVKSHLDRNSTLFLEIKERVKDCLD